MPSSLLAKPFLQSSKTWRDDISQVRLNWSNLGPLIWGHDSLMEKPVTGIYSIWLLIFTFWMVDDLTVDSWWCLQKIRLNTPKPKASSPQKLSSFFESSCKFSPKNPPQFWGWCDSERGILGIRASCHAPLGWGVPPRYPKREKKNPKGHLTNHFSHENNPLTFPWNTGCFMMGSL